MLEDFHDRGIYLTEDEYRTGLRVLFPEEYQEFSDEELEDILTDRISRMSPYESEGFFNSLGNFFKNQVAPVALAALPAVTTAVGTIYGGPAGGAIGSALGGAAANAISGATHIKPNATVAGLAGIATNLASGGMGNLASSLAGGAAGGSGARGATGAAAGVSASGAAGNPSAGAGNAPAAAGQGNATPAATQLLGFLQSTPFLQSMLSGIATGRPGGGLQIPTEDGGVTNTSYLEMLESLKYLTENAIIEADNAGFAGHLPIESEADKDSYIESVIESVGSYETALLPNYDAIAYR